ncbi:MAG: hypothetical protein Q8L57_00205, partial [bacterium]|nr:hypothetical protein [bacterium]
KRKDLSARSAKPAIACITKKQGNNFNGSARTAGGAVEKNKRKNQENGWEIKAIVDDLDFTVAVDGRKFRLEFGGCRKIRPEIVAYKHFRSA